MLCPEGNGRLNELEEFRVSAGGCLDYLFCKFSRTFINLTFIFLLIFANLCCRLVSSARPEVLGLTKGSPGDP